MMSEFPKKKNLKRFAWYFLCVEVLLFLGEEQKKSIISIFSSSPNLQVIRTDNGLKFVPGEIVSTENGKKWPSPPEYFKGKSKELKKPMMTNSYVN